MDELRKSLDAQEKVDALDIVPVSVGDCDESAFQ
jgi:hypothetical protein